MKHAFVLLLCLPFAASAQPPSQSPALSSGEPEATATAELKDGKGRPAGTATFTQRAGMVRLEVRASGLAPGLHGIHVHEKGRCDGPGFTSAGGHFNPHGRKHGTLNEKGAHAGDLPNIEADAQGNASAKLTLMGVTLERGQKNSLLDADGSALVIHAKEDDEKTDPSGNSGDRVACGVIKGGA